MAAFIHVDEANFEQLVLQAANPVLLEFGAAWCQPCKQLEPVLLKLGEQWGQRVTLAKVDVDESVGLTVRFQVMGVPTVILFKSGQAVTRFSGFQSREKLLEKLSPHL